MSKSILKKIASTAVVATMLCSALAVSTASAAEVKGEQAKTPRTFTFCADGPQIADSQVSIYLWDSTSSTVVDNGEYGSAQMNSVNGEDGKAMYYTYTEESKDAAKNFDRVIFKVNDNKTEDMTIPEGTDLTYTTTYVGESKVVGEFTDTAMMTQTQATEKKTYTVSSDDVDLSNSQVSIYLWNSDTKANNGQFGSAQMNAVRDEDGNLTGFSYTDNDTSKHFDKVIFKVNGSQTADLDIPADGEINFDITSIEDKVVNGVFA